jgi:hypothetical protein
MKAGRSLVELAQLIEDNKAAKADYIADTRELRVTDEGDKLKVNGHAEAEITDHCYQQIGDRLSIPKKYMDRMRSEAPALLATNVNHWFQAKPERRMVRTLNGRARAFLSDRYQRIDHEEIAAQVLPILAEVPGLQCVSSEITETRLYLKFTTSRIVGEVKKGDLVEAGVLVTNSEIGAGAVGVRKFRRRCVCDNGMIIDEGSLRAAHIGRQASADESVYAMLTDETLRADDRAILLKVRDVCKAVISQESLDADLARMREATERRIEGNPVEAIEVLGKKVGLSDTEQGSILRYLIEGGDITQYGVMNAVTRFAHDPVDYDRATELEKIGARVIDLHPSEWRQIATAGEGRKAA